ncbi:MAG: maltose alpha-D-glucosyltransferase / alpha-amylase [Solirubrobacteraceae bacterium]|jgi:maltose alpha-D-glucosyltransferase/alpha-amylase|nr:maltose alpha-D-glucosyltransferase / alpha-amylase [Solirubrobacteraceae bacterium]
MLTRWYRTGAIYSVDAGLFQDSDDDGIGDFRGLMGRLDYLARLGVTTIWLNPIHPSPRRDGGYDVCDYYGVHPRLGSLGDFATFMHEADERGIRVMLDLVVNHTSDAHPWFQAARSDPRSPFRDWYVWSETEPADRFEGMVFPGVENETWTYDTTAGAWYRHRFYRFEPDLNTDHPAVRDEIRKITLFWLRLGVAGFRIDAAPFLIEPKTRAEQRAAYEFLGELREWLSWQRGDAVMLAEANVSDDELVEYFGQSDGSATRVLMVFAFRLNQAMILALARQDARPIAATLRELPPLPRHGQWATFLRNHDEVDLGRLTDEERQEVFEEFGPEEHMQLYGRGIRRRLAPMLGGNRRRIELAYSLQLSMPGTPVIRYGDEIGMGDNLDLPEREAIRTPMQWDDTRNAGFSGADPARLVAPVVDFGPFDYRRVNVTSQRLDPHGLLTWFERILHGLRECAEIGSGDHTVIDAGPPHVLVHRADGASGSTLFAHNLADRPCTLDLSAQRDPEQRPIDFFADSDYGRDADLGAVDVAGFGYRWIRLRQRPGR